MCEARLLTSEIDAIYGLAPGRASTVCTLISSEVSVVFGWSPGARVLAASHDLHGLLAPSGPARTLLHEGRFEPGRVPPVVDDLRKRLEQSDPGSNATIAGGPSFTFPADLPVEVGADLPIIVSDDAGTERARALCRPDNWEPDEWAELIAGERGGWAMALHDNRPVSICHTPASNDEAAEAGIWTHEDYRGQGLAPAVTAAWWTRERLTKHVLFYSTSSDNLASQAVARKLGLDPLGWLWTIRREARSSPAT